MKKKDKIFHFIFLLIVNVCASLVFSMVLLVFMINYYGIADGGLLAGVIALLLWLALLFWQYYETVLLVDAKKDN